MDPEDYARLTAELAPALVAHTQPITAATGRVSAEDVIAPVPIPAFATSAMDGFALDARCVNLARAGETMPVEGDIPAGYERIDVEAGRAVRVMTGAPVPATAEVVVPVEFTDARRAGPAPRTIRIVNLPEDLRPGWNIRAIGEDIRTGAIVVEKDRLVTPAAIGVLAMLGLSHISVRAQPVVGVIVTGDELAHTDPGDGPFIHNSNLPMLVSALESIGARAYPKVCGDDPGTFTSILEELAEQTDLIITTGGISAGAFEVVRMVLEDSQSTFSRIGMRPGGPQGHGWWTGRSPDPHQPDSHRADGKRTGLLHFPGTPSAAFVSFHLFARPLIEGRPLATRWRTAVYAGQTLSGHRRGVSIMPGRFDARGKVGALGSLSLRDFAKAEVLIRLPPAPSVISTGDMVKVLDL